MDAVKNFAKGTVDGVYESADTEIDVLLNHGDRFPDVPFNAVWWNATDYPDPSDDPIKEIVRVTARTADTLTITRAQEGTAAEDHNEAGKTYQLIAGITALAWSTLLGDVFGSGVAIFVNIDDETIQLKGANVQSISMGVSSILIQSLSAALGDIEANGNSSHLEVNDSLQLISVRGKLGTNQSAAASVAVGTLAAKMPIYDDSNTLLGYIPIYNSIT